MTDRLGLGLPSIGGDDDGWGEKLNNDLQRIDDASPFSTLTFGAPGEGLVSEVAELQEALNAASALGVANGTIVPVELVPNGLYLVDFVASGLCLEMKPNVRLKGNGARIKLMDNAADIARASGTTVIATVTRTLSTIQAGSSVIGSKTGTSLIVADASGFSVGQVVETFGEVMKVTAIVGTTLTVQRAYYGVASDELVAGKSVNTTYENMHIEDLIVDGNKGGNPSYQFDHDGGIQLNYGINCSVLRCRVINPRADSISLLLCWNSKVRGNWCEGGERVGLNARLSNFCSFIDNDVRQSANYGMKMEHPGGDSKAYGNVFAKNRIVAGGMIALSGIQDHKLYDMKVEGNTFDIANNDISAIGIPISILCCDRFKITNNTINGGTSVSIGVTRDCIDGEIAGNSMTGFIGTAADLGGAVKLGGSSITGVDDIKVHDNTIIGAPQVGISLAPATAGTKQPRGIKIHDNRIENCGLQGMDILSGDHTQVHHNTLKNNGGNAVASGVAGAVNAGIYFRKGSVPPAMPMVDHNTFVSDGTNQTTGIDANVSGAAVDVTITDNIFENTATPVANKAFFTGSPHIRNNRGLNGSGQPDGTGTWYSGSGVPSDANLGVNGDFYARTDGTVAGNTVLYHKQSGAWVPLVTA